MCVRESAILIAVIYAVASAIFFLKKSARRIPRHRSISSKAASIHGILPSHWSWKTVTSNDVSLRESLLGGKIAAGSYASRVVDQHRSGWCGCCYMVACLQMIQDRTHVLIGTEHADLLMYPMIEFDAQNALSAYHKYQSKLMPMPWNACRGGDPLKVLKAIEDRHVSLIVSTHKGFAWHGHPCGDHTTSDGASDHRIRISNARKIEDASVDAIKREVFAKGAVVLGINAAFLLSHDESGFVSPSPGDVDPRNHAVTVVGWLMRDGKDYWVVRNSWGFTSVPTAKPEDVRCVYMGGNECDVKTKKWAGDAKRPGYLYVPCAHPHLHEQPSPWYACEVNIKP